MIVFREQGEILAMGVPIADGEIEDTHFEETLKLQGGKRTMIANNPRHLLVAAGILAGSTQYLLHVLASQLFQRTTSFAAIGALDRFFPD